MKMLLIQTMLVALALLPAYHAWAGDPVVGKEKSVSCSPCHGKNGISKSPEYPNLAGQNEAYIVKALQAYRSRSRNVLTMIAMVKDLTDEDIADIAAYFAGLPRTGATAAPPPPQ